MNFAFNCFHFFFFLNFEFVNKIAPDIEGFFNNASWIGKDIMLYDLSKRVRMNVRGFPLDEYVWFFLLACFRFFAQLLCVWMKSYTFFFSNWSACKYTLLYSLFTSRWTGMNWYDYEVDSYYAFTWTGMCDQIKWGTLIWDNFMHWKVLGVSFSDVLVNGILPGSWCIELLNLHSLRAGFCVWWINYAFTYIFWSAVEQ